MKMNKKILYVSAGLAVFILSCYASFLMFQSVIKEKEDSNQVTNQVEEPEKISETPPIEIVIKDSVQLIVPYTVQAPYANWTVHEESCEEAAALMYHYFLNGKNFPNNIIPPDKASAEMIAMKNWQKANYGVEPDLNLDKFGEFVKSYYGNSYSVKKNITIEDIKKELSAGNPVVVPVITHGLENPHYGRLPSYHLLVITGYDARGVITNDAGVKEGQNYFYTWEVLFRAIDAQTPKMNQGRDLIVFS